MLGESEPPDARGGSPDDHVLHVVGLSHRSAPLGVRERFAFDREAIPGALERLRQGGAREAVVLATCNRTELYATLAPDAPPWALEELLVARAAAILGDGPARAAFEKHAARATGHDAARHLFRVAASLDSLVVGEDQILAQVKTAYDAATRQGSVGARLHALFQAAIKAGKRVRRETAIGESKLSVSSVAIDFMERVFHDLSQKKVLLVGAGDAARLTLVHLRARGVKTVRIANRSVEKARRLAEALGGEAVPFDAIPQELVRADIVVTSVGLPRPIIDGPTVARALRERRGRNLFFLDIAVPRDVDAAVEALDGAYVCNLDELQRVVNESYARRVEDVTAAERIADDELARHLGRERHRSLGPIVSLILGRADRAAHDEAKALAEKHGLDPSVRDDVERLAERLVRRVLHEPLTAIRREARERDDDAVARLLERVLAEGRTTDSQRAARQPAPEEEPGTP